VYSAVPGELAPKLAIASAFEDEGAFRDGAHWYDVVSRTDPGFTSAAFGLARCLRALDDLAGALEAYERVPETSSASFAARVALADALLDDGWSHTRADIAAASAVIERLPAGDERRADLAARLYEVALAVVRRDGDDAGAPPVLGRAFTETSIRFGLEDAYRTLARLSASTSARIQWVDRANAARPRTLV
jgi:serine/threonine-protein kinase PknG